MLVGDRGKLLFILFEMIMFDTSAMMLAVSGEGETSNGSEIQTAAKIV